MNLNIILTALALLYIILVLFMRRGWLAIKPVSTNQAMPLTKVSVLIAARNEEENIGRTLDCLIAQDYPKVNLEIIVIDDHSTDRTSEKVLAYADKGVKLIRLQLGDRLNSYKKYAINEAISCASGDIIVTTDADCRMGKNWLRTIIGKFEQDSLYMLSSPVVYNEEKSFFEELQTLEFLYLIGLGAAGIGNGMPTTCNGANLAYRKDIFYAVDGFKGIDELASGDDELLLHKVAERYPGKIGFCKSREAIVYTDAKPDLKSFISQRRRWASKSTKYKNKKVVFIGAAIWTFNLLLASAILAAILGFPIVDNSNLISVLLAKFAVELFFMWPLTQFAQRSSLLKYLPFLTIAHSYYLTYIGIMGNIGKYDWKGRQVK